MTKLGNKGGDIVIRNFDCLNSFEVIYLMMNKITYRESAPTFRGNWSPPAVIYFQKRLEVASIFPG